MADEQTLEERVEALEAAVENAYALNFSGAQINELLDFIDKRKLQVGRKTAVDVHGSGAYKAVTDIDYNAYSSRPVCFAEMCYIGSTTGIENRLVTAIQQVFNENGKIVIYIAPESIPSTARTLYIKYIIMEAML